MITFMPMINYREALRSLDDARLDKQILEVEQIVNAIMDPEDGYRNHPCTRMWSPYVLNLLTYGIYAVGVWAERQRKNPMERDSRMYSRQVAIANHMGSMRAAKSHQIPMWVGDIDFHESHRSNLIRKDPIHYNSWPCTPINMPYLWPHVVGPDEYKLYISVADQKRLQVGERVLPEYLEMLPDGEVIYDEGRVD